MALTATINGNLIDLSELEIKLNSLEDKIDNISTILGNPNIVNCTNQINPNISEIFGELLCKIGENSDSKYNGQSTIFGTINDTDVKIGEPNTVNCTNQTNPDISQIFGELLCKIGEINDSKDNGEPTIFGTINDTDNKIGDLFHSKDKGEITVFGALNDIDNKIGDTTDSKDNGEPTIFGTINDTDDKIGDTTDSKDNGEPTIFGTINDTDDKIGEPEPIIVKKCLEFDPLTGAKKTPCPENTGTGTVSGMLKSLKEASEVTEALSENTNITVTDTKKVLIKSFDSLSNVFSLVMNTVPRKSGGSKCVEDPKIPKELAELYFKNIEK